MFLMRLDFHVYPVGPNGGINRIVTTSGMVNSPRPKVLTVQFNFCTHSARGDTHESERAVLPVCADIVGLSRALALSRPATNCIEAIEL